MDQAIPPGYMLVPVQGNGATNPTNQLVAFQPITQPEPPKEPPKESPREPPMVPGKEYIMIPPGHTKPAFVRKKRQSTGWGLRLLGDAFADPRRDVIQVASKPKEEPKPKPKPEPPHAATYYYLMPQQNQQLQIAQPGMQPGLPQSQAQLQLMAPPPPAQATPNPQSAATSAATPAAPANEVKAPDGQSNLTIARHQCFYCHKDRSAGFHRRHPIHPGQIMLPTVCRKCERQRTPSGDEDEKKRSHSASAKEKSKDESRKRKERRRQRKEATRKQKGGLTKSDEESLDRFQNDGVMYRSRRRRSLSGVRYVPNATRASSRVVERNPRWGDRRHSNRSEGEDPDWIRSRLRIQHRSWSQESRGTTASQDYRRIYPRDETHTTRQTYLTAPYSHDGPRVNHARRFPSRSMSHDSVRPDNYEQGMASSEDETHIIRRTIVREPSYEYEVPRGSARSQPRSGSSSTDYDQRDVKRYTVIQSRPISQEYSPSRSTKDHTRDYRETGRRIVSYPDAYRREHDSDFDEESRSRSRSRSRSQGQTRGYGTPTQQSSYKASSHHTSTPYPKRHLDYKERHNDRPQGTYSGHIHGDQRSPEGRTHYKPPLPTRHRSISRPVRISSALESQRHWDSDTADAGGPRVQFVRDSSTRRNTISDRDSDVAGRSRQRQRRRVADFDGYEHGGTEHDYTSMKRLAPAITYRASSPPRPATTSWNTQPRYLTAGPHDTEAEISDMFREARIAYSPSVSPRGRSSSRGGSPTGGRDVSSNTNRNSSSRPPSHTRQPSAGRSDHRPLQRRSSGWSVSSANTERPSVHFEPDESGRLPDEEDRFERQVVARGRDSKGKYYDVLETVTLGGREGQTPSWSDSAGRQSDTWGSQDAPTW